MFKLIQIFKRYQRNLRLETWGFIQYLYLLLFKKSKIASIAKSNLFIVGLPKCGTSSLHTYLCQHTEIMSAKDKELAHFSYKYTALVNRKLGMRYWLNYRYAFKKHINETYLLDTTPNYIYHRESLLKIHQHNKHAKIIILFRNPLQRIISSYYQKLKYRRQKELEQISLEDYVIQIINNTGLYNDCASHIFGYRLYSSPYIKAVYQIFDKENIYFMRLEVLAKEPQNAFNQLLGFLNLEMENIALTEIHNKGDIKNNSLSQSTEKKLFELLTPDLQIIEALTGEHLLNDYRHQ